LLCCSPMLWKSVVEQRDSSTVPLVIFLQVLYCFNRGIRRIDIVVIAWKNQHQLVEVFAELRILASVHI